MGPFPVFRHSIHMVARTIKKYTLLSVTIIISFSALLAYLLYTDSSIYNEYKELFSKRRGDFIVGELRTNGTRLNVFIEKTADLENTMHYVMYDGFSLIEHTQIETNSGSEAHQISIQENCYLLYFPDDAWLVESILTTSAEIVWGNEQEREMFALAADEVILNEWKYYQLGLNQIENPIYTFRLSNNINLTLRVVGYVREKNRETGQNYTQMILSTKAIDKFNLTTNEELCYSKTAVFYTEKPEILTQLADSMGFGKQFGDSRYSIYEEQNIALDAIRYEKKNKSVIASALLLLLGVNLYSSFNNALSDRKFEIGVKRAIGASGWSIVRQFLYESLTVMIANVLISVTLVINAFVTYKFFYERTPDRWGNYYQWIIYISPYSVAMFGVCAVSLSLVFSLVFAYKATQVEIVRHLKSE